MPIFYYHPQNIVPKQLAEQTGKKGFMYSGRGQLDLTLQKLLLEAGHDVSFQFHTIVGSLGRSLDELIPLNPDDELDRHTLKICEQKAPWSYIKVRNGDESYIMGYVSSSGGAPFALSATEMAQKGIIGSSYIPRPM